MRRVHVGASCVLGVVLVLCAAPSATTGSSASPTLQQLLDHAAVDLPFNPELASVSCPIERAAVKEDSDADRFKVSTTISYTSIATLRTKPKPSSYPAASRITSTELHTWQVTAYLTQYKQEADGDYHLVLKDSGGRQMIAEMPYLSCVPTSSRWRTAIASARTSFAKAYSVTTSWHYVHRLIDVRGIGFMDTIHGQTGVAPNGVELHPVTYIHLH